MRTGLTSIAFLVLAAAPCLAQASPPSTKPDVADIAVARIDDLGMPFELKTNLYLPGATPAPLLLYIHGKGGSYNDPRDKVVLRVLEAMRAKGIAVARIDYRRSGRMPQMLFDTKAYIRFFRANAAKYHIDPARIGIWGVSRGGNLAAMLAVTGDVKELEGDIGGNSGQSSVLQASVIESPLTDMFLSSDEKAAPMFGDYLGTNDQDSRAIVAAYRKHDSGAGCPRHRRGLSQARHRQSVLERRAADRAGESAELCRQEFAARADCLRRPGPQQCDPQLQRHVRQVYPAGRDGVLLCAFHRHPCPGRERYRTGGCELAFRTAGEESAARFSG